MSKLQSVTTHSNYHGFINWDWRFPNWETWHAYGWLNFNDSEKNKWSLTFDREGPHKTAILMQEEYNRLIFSMCHDSNMLDGGFANALMVRFGEQVNWFELCCYTRTGDWLTDWLN